MDESDLEEWFTEQKELLEKTFFKALMDKKNPERAKAHFDKKYRGLIKKYQHKRAHLYTQEQRREKIQKPINAVKNGYKQAIHNIQTRATTAVAAVKKWFFEQKIKRILKQR